MYNPTISEERGHKLHRFGWLCSNDACNTQIGVIGFHTDIRTATDTTANGKRYIDSLSLLHNNRIPLFIACDTASNPVKTNDLQLELAAFLEGNLVRYPESKYTRREDKIQIFDLNTYKKS